VDSNDSVPLVSGHVDERAVAQDARIADERVKPAKCVERSLHDGARTVPIRDIARVGNGSAAGVLDLAHDFRRRRPAAAGAITLTTEIVDDYERTVPRKSKSVLPTESAPAARDDCDATREIGAHRTATSAMTRCLDGRITFSANGRMDSAIASASEAGAIRSNNGLRSWFASSCRGI
jgi:hypothetical protein